MSPNHLFWLAVASAVMAALLFKWWALRSWIGVPGRITGHDMVTDDGIANVLRRASTPQAACNELVAAALANGGKDNVTVALASVT